MIRWALALQAYTYDLQHKPGKQHTNADALSRIPYPNNPSSGTLGTPGATVQLIEELDSGPISATDIEKATKKDSILAWVHHHVLVGWPQSVDDRLRRFQLIKNELSVHGGAFFGALG